MFDEMYLLVVEYDDGYLFIIEDNDRNILTVEYDACDLLIAIMEGNYMLFNYECDLLVEEVLMSRSYLFMSMISETYLL